MKIALALICKGTNEEADLLARCLSYAAPHVDGIFITSTHKHGEAPNKKVAEVAKLYKATLSTFEWINDFPAARNFNFSQVPTEYDYILWCDADDAFRGLEKLRDTITENPADTYAMFYLYAFDEQKNPIVVHQKTRVVKNDGCVKWTGIGIHEDFSPQRQVTSFLIEGIEVLHLSNDTRVEQSKTRNLEIAQEQVRLHPDDPRTYWNLGNALFSSGEFQEAFDAFETFIKTSNSDDEKYIVRLRRAETQWLLNNRDKAIEEAQIAVGIKPEFPDAYFTLASFTAAVGKIRKAAELYLQGLVKPRPYHRIIVYNPRDYDYTPMLKLANLYFQLSRPDLALPLLEGCLKIYPDNKDLKKTVASLKKEVKKFDEIVLLIKRLQKIKDKTKLKKELDKIPDDFKSHPGICNLRNMNFLKEHSSGKDLVIYCGFTEEEWTPETIKKKGIGGSEEAVLHLSRLWAEAGWNVTVYNNCGYKEQIFDGVTYAPYWTWNYKDKQDVVILWRTPIYLDFDINCSKVYVDMHDALPPQEFTDARVKKATKIFVKSQFHRSLYPHIPDEKFVIVPNGILPEVFDQEFKRNQFLIINTSAPDRSITTLVDMFPEIKKRVPEARLQWAYGWGTFDTVYHEDQKVMAWKAELQRRMKEYGVEELGRVNHQDVAKLYMTANVWAYPSAFAEIDCISLSKALAGGAIPVTSDFAAMGEKQGHGGFFFPEQVTKDTWSKPGQMDFASTDKDLIQKSIDKIVHLLKSPPDELTRNSMRDWAKKTYDWKTIAIKWIEEFNGNQNQETRAST